MPPHQATHQPQLHLQSKSLSSQLLGTAKCPPIRHPLRLPPITSPQTNASTKRASHKALFSPGRLGTFYQPTGIVISPVMPPTVSTAAADAIADTHKHAYHHNTQQRHRGRGTAYALRFPRRRNSIVHVVSPPCRRLQPQQFRAIYATSKAPTNHCHPAVPPSRTIYYIAISEQ